MNGILPQSPSLRIILALGGGILALLICLLCALTLPGVLGSTAQTPTVIAQARTATGTPTGTPTGTSTTTTTPTLTLTPPPTQPPTNTPTSLPCVPNAVFVADVTFPNGSALAPGTPFIKTWRVRNSGNCTWDSSYSIVFVGGIAMGPGTAPVPFAVPGAIVDISLPMTAPAAPGSYSGIWRLRSPSGALFGINLSVLITVLRPTTATPTYTATATPTRTPLILIDFVKQAPNADWSNGEVSLPFQGSDTDSRGFVIWREGTSTMEDGTVPQLALETHPQWVTEGYVEGFYSKFPLAVKKGDQLHVKVGFIQGAGVGDVTFNVAYDSCGDGCWTDIVSIHHAYDGTLIEQIVDISSILTHLSTRTTIFRLRVSANNKDASQDWATWVIAQIERPQP